MITSYQEYTEALTDGRDGLFIGEAMLAAVFGDLSEGCDNILVAVDGGRVVACRVERQYGRARIVEVMEFEVPVVTAAPRWLEQIYCRPGYDPSYDELPLSDGDASTFGDLNRRILHYVDQMNVTDGCFTALLATLESAPMRHVLERLSGRCPVEVSLGGNARRLPVDNILFDHAPTLYAGTTFEATFGHEFDVVIPTTDDAAEIRIGGVAARRARYRATIDAIGNIAHDITSASGATRTVSLRPDILRIIELKPLSNIQA